MAASVGQVHSFKWLTIANESTKRTMELHNKQSHDKQSNERLIWSKIPELYR